MIGDSWHGAVKLAGQIDRGMNVGRRLMGALSPAIDALGGGGHMKALDDGFSKYDATRGQVVEGINNVQRLHKKIQTAVTEIDL